MRELWATGYVTNRARLVAASFLVKHLRIHWREGESWFWDTLLDADLANNAASWQWVAGNGADAALYFRIFNPHGAGKKIRPGPTSEAGVRLGDTHPVPIVDHVQARVAASEGFEIINKHVSRSLTP